VHGADVATTNKADADRHLSPSGGVTRRAGRTASSTEARSDLIDTPFDGIAALMIRRARSCAVVECKRALDGGLAVELLRGDSKEPNAARPMSTALSSSAAVRASSDARSVGSASVRDRVIVRKSP